MPLPSTADHRPSSARTTLAIRTWVCRCGSEAALRRWLNRAATKPEVATSPPWRRAQQPEPSSQPKASAQARRCAASTMSAASGGPRAARSDTDLGAVKIRSQPPRRWGVRRGDKREAVAGPAPPKHRIEGRAADHPFEAEVAPAGAAPATCYRSIEVVAPGFLAEPVHDQHPNGGGGRRGAATKPWNIMKYYRIAVRRASVSPGQQPARQPRAGGFLLQLRRPRRAVLCAVSATSGSDGGPGRGCARRRHRRPADLDQFDHRCADRRPGLGHDQSRASAVRGEKPDRP